MRRDKLLTYALTGSIVFHIALLGLVGKTSAAKPISVEQLKIVRVDLVKTPDQPSIRQEKPDTAKPQSEPEKVETSYVPPTNQMVTDKRPPKPRHETQTTNTKPGRTLTTDTGSQKPAGNPGGPLNGITSPNGQNMGSVPPGNTTVGWVPGSASGVGIGPGTDPGIGNPEPTPGAVHGPGLTPAPPPPPPPQPKMVSVTVCEVSGMLPGPYCEHKESKSFKEGSEPNKVCNECKAPHHNTIADRSEPELERDVKVKLPELDDSGNYTVQIRYTVDTEGNVKDIEITESSGIAAIDHAVREAASKMHYKPAVQNGEPRAVKAKRKYKISI